LLKLLILKFVKNVKVNMVMGQHAAASPN